MSDSSTTPAPDASDEHDGPHRDTDDHDQKTEGEGGLTVSAAGSSFSDSETAGGGADALPGSPDTVPHENHEANEFVDDDELLS